MSKRNGLNPKDAAHPPHHVMKISQPERGGNGERAFVVNDLPLRGE
jgi:hypothetical protein